MPIPPPLHRLPMLELHYSPGNASMTPHMLLEELGVPFTLKLVDRTRQAHKCADYLELNPNGLIPVLIDGDLVLYETAAICLHLADTHPQPAWRRRSARASARTSTSGWPGCTNTLQAALIIYFYPERWADDAAGDRAGEGARRGDDRPRCSTSSTPQLARHGGPWLLGDAFSAVDPYAFVLCRWTRGFARPARSAAASRRRASSACSRGRRCSARSRARSWRRRSSEARRRRGAAQRQPASLSARRQRGSVAACASAREQRAAARGRRRARRRRAASARRRRAARGCRRACAPRAQRRDRREAAA